MAPVYLIGLMDVPIDHPDKDFWKDRYVSEYTFREKESHDLLGEYASQALKAGYTAQPKGCVACFVQ